MKNKKELEEKIRAIDMLKDQNFEGKIMITSDMHMSDPFSHNPRKDIINKLDRVFKEAYSRGARIALDLGDRGFDGYHKLAKKNGLVAGLSAYELNKLSGDSYLKGKKILSCHYLEWCQGKDAKMSYGSFDGDCYEKEKIPVDMQRNYTRQIPCSELENFLEKRKKEPILILKGHDHISFVTTKISGKKKIREIIPYMTDRKMNKYYKKIIYYPKKEEKVDIKEPGLYFVGAGQYKFAILDIKKGGYTIRNSGYCL